MKSAGNDIVALNAVNIQRTVSSNFYSKFIVPAEEKLFEQSSGLKAVAFYKFVWLLWSVKESAYKYFKRLQPEMIFSPSKIVIENLLVSDEGFLYGPMLFQGLKLYYRSWLTEEYIATVVNDDLLFKGVHHEVIKIEDADSKSQSEAIRELALQKLKSILNQGDLTISKTQAGYPAIMLGTQQSGIPLSLAHHDLFVGYSFKVGPDF